MLGSIDAARYAVRMQAYLGLGMQSHVIEVASSDGYLLQHFSKLGIPVIGIEPDHAVAVRAMKVRGIPTLTGSFGLDMARRLAAEGLDAGLIMANHALLRVSDVDDFLAGFALLLNAEGVATFELAPLSALTLRTTERLLTASGLRLFDVEPLGGTSGALQLFACRADSAWHCGPRVGRTLTMGRPAVH